MIIHSEHSQQSKPFSVMDPWYVAAYSHQMHPSLLDPSTFNNNTNPPTPTEQKLQRHVNPSDSSDIWGIDLYVDTLQFLFS